MSQHFLLTAAARNLSLKGIFRMSDDEAHDTFTAIRFADNGGAAFCPRCQCTAVYTYTVRRIWKCKACQYQFSGVVQSWVTREGGLALPRRMMAPSRFQRWCEYGSRCWRSGEAARE